MIFIVALCFVGAAAFAEAANRHTISANIAYYARMGQVYEYAEREARDLESTNDAGFVRLVIRLGEEALSDNGEWMVGYYE
jgi:hypothetical protein